MTTPTIDPAKLAGITLAKGGHGSPEQGLCLLEAVAYVLGVPHTDRPACVSPVLGGMGRGLNDVLPDDLRQQLVPLIPDLPGTAGDGHDETRSYMALDWLIRDWLPAWLDLSPACREDAAKVRALDRIVDLASAERAGAVVRETRTTTAAAAEAAAWEAAGGAAWAAVTDAARAAARDVAEAAAEAAAAGTAWEAARAAAWTAAWTAARDAARDAAEAALQPTVAVLQVSAIDLFTRMARIGQGNGAAA